MTRENAIRRLFGLWAVVAAAPALLVTAQTIAGKYGDDAQIAWSWLFAQITPVLAILLAAVFSEPSSRWKSAQAHQWKFSCALGASIAQAVLMLSVLIIEPLVTVSTFDLFDKTQIILSLLQGVVVAAVGAVIFDGR